MGEGGWSALEVIIVLVLVIALLGKIFGTGIGLKSDTASKPKQEKVTTQAPVCGKLVVKTPTSLQNISITSTGIPVEAIKKSCLGDSSQLTGSYLITIVDSGATPVADPVEVPLGYNGQVSGFNHFIQFVAPPKKGKGYLIITEVSNDSSTAQDGVRVPIRFVN